uniref:Integrase catalytic domain-containing protein n=1 Tax=Fagus sylvatica TaxID=28930 RepID=A0A2N9ESE9_FAGSY
MHKLATTCQMKGHRPSTRPEIQRTPEGHSTDFLETSVGAVCGKRASLPFTAPIQKDCMVRTRSMEIHAQALPSSSQSPEVAAMEKQVRDLTANLQELTRQGKEMTIEESTAKWEQEMKAMRAQMGEMKDEFKGRAAKNLDDLVHGTDSPFTKKVTSFPLPSKFRMPTLETFDGSKDPLDQLESFKTMMCLQGVPDEIICRAFPTTLKGPARIWFKKLMPSSVGSFAQLSCLFFNHFIGGQRCGRPTTHLLNVKQKEGEILRSYLTRFNKETLLVEGADDKVTEKKPKLEDLPITFTEEDARKVFHPHDDALVVTLEIAGYSTRRVLIDNGSFADIIYLTAFQQMKIGKDQLRPIETPLVGFAGTSVYPLGVISLQIVAGTYPKQATKKVDFLVVDCPSAYNVIVGRPTLNRLRAVTSTYHLLVRFPTENGIGEMRGDQAMARECYLTSISTEPIHQTLIVEERSRQATDGRLHKGSLLPGMACQRGDGQKIHGKMANVCRLHGFKQSYPLPRIDQLVDSTTGHKLLSFMDAFSGYNQIQMTEEDQEKTAFITSRGLFCYKAMPFGLKNAGATYQRLVNKMFHDQIGRNVEVYVDDILVKNKKDDDHLADLKETFQALRRYNMKLNPAKCVFGVSSSKFLGFMVSQRRIEANLDKIKDILEMSPPKTVKEVQSLTGKAAALNRFVSRSTDKCLPFFKTLRKAFQWTEECQQDFEELKVYLTSPPLLSPSQTREELFLYLAAMNKPDAAGRLVQWSIEMSEFDIDYRPRTAIKAQALADFIAEFTHPLKEDEQSEEDEAWTVNIDRSSTKKMSGARVILVSPEKDKLEYALQLRFRATNNEAEYEALLAGLKLSKTKEERMKKYLTVVKDLLTHFKKVELLQIPREENIAADRLARLASSGIEIDGFIEIQGRPSMEEEIVNSITVNTTWMSPIIHYLREGTLPTDRTEAHKLRIRASHFRLLGGILYKMGFSRPHLRCLSPEEANYVIREVHEGICGNHSGARSLAHKLTRAGYYWPSLLHDATQYVKTCDKCQRFANVPRVPPEEITPITSPWPFAQWGLDIMGPFPVGTKQAKFLVVAIDYFTKWVEAEPLATISEKNVKSFVWKAVICRFGIPRVLISDNGKQFDNGPFREMCSQLNIKNHYSSPRHPQANSQVEITNLTLLKQIKTRLEGAKSMWVEELPSVLWAYRTTVRTPTKETPFKLTFGTEAVIPVEIGLTTLRTTFHKEEENEGQLRLSLDLLDETREKAAQRIALYQGKMARYYNTKVKLRRFEVGDWVLRKVTQATKDPSQRKLGPNWEGSLQDHPILPKRHLSSRRPSWKEAASSLER